MDYVACAFVENVCQQLTRHHRPQLLCLSRWSGIAYSYFKPCFHVYLEIVITQSGSIQFALYPLNKNLDLNLATKSLRPLLHTVRVFKPFLPFKAQSYSTFDPEKLLKLFSAEIQPFDVVIDAMDAEEMLLQFVKRLGRARKLSIKRAPKKLEIVNELLQTGTLEGLDLLIDALDIEHTANLLIKLHENRNFFSFNLGFSKINYDVLKTVERTYKAFCEEKTSFKVSKVVFPKQITFVRNCALSV